MIDPYYGGLDLEEMLKASKSPTADRLIKDNFETISQNTVYEDYDYNSTHFLTRGLNYSLFIPDGLEDKIKSIEVKVKQQQYNYMEPMMYDTANSLPTIEEKEIPVDIEIDTIETTGEMLYGNIVLDKKDLELSSENGTSFTLQVYLKLIDGSSVPYSQFGYMYVNPVNTDGVKSDLMNAYYYQSAVSYGYPDVSRMLAVAFEKAEKKAGSLEEYIAVLKKALEKSETLVEKYNTQQDEIAMKVHDEESFAAQVEAFGKIMQKTNILNDAKWQIQTEILSRENSDVINELFE